MTTRLPWFPGYTVAGVATVALLATAPGQTLVISQFNTSLRESFGIDELTLNTAYTVATVLAALPLVWLGRWTDRMGVRRMMALVALAFGVGCFAMAAAAGPATVFLGFFLLRFLGQGSLGLVSQHAVAMWFHRRLGAVHGVKLVIVFGAWVLLPQLAVWMIGEVGWRSTYIVFGLVIWAVVVPLALLFVRNKPEDLGLRMDNDGVEERDGDGADLEVALGPVAAAAAIAEDEREDERGAGPSAREAEPAFTLGEAVRTRAYWTVAAATFLSPLIATGVLFDIQPMMLERGMTVRDAANAVSVWTAGMCIMSLPAGFITDRFHPAAVLTAGMGMVAASCGVLLVAAGFGVVVAAMLAFAVGQALVMACSMATIARFYGRAHHGAIRSSVSRIGVFGTGLGTIVTGVSVWATGGYGAALVGFGVMCVPVMGLTVGLRAPGVRGRSGGVGA